MDCSYLIIGSGRVAKHFAHYFELEKKSYWIWNRSQSVELLHSLLKPATHVLLLISDDQIQTFYRDNLASVVANKTVVHFSGSFSHPDICSVHPLMTFSHEMYDLPFYRDIFFINFSGRDFKDVLPGFDNSQVSVDPVHKSFYHSLCVMGGNFTHILTQKMLAGFRQIGIPNEAANLYLHKNLDNALRAPNSLTGPLVRKDFKTIAKNMDALAQDPFQKIYFGFVNTFLNEVEMLQIQKEMKREMKNEHPGL